MTARRKRQTWLSTEPGGYPAEPTRRTLDRLALGDPGALAEIYEAYGASAYRLAVRISGSRSEAQDVVQDLFLGLSSTVTSYRGEGNFSAWFRTCAARQALLHMRRRQRRREVRLDPNCVSTTPPCSLDTIELDGAVSRLPATLRVVLVLREVEGFSCEEVERMLGISPSACRMRLMRARRRLRAMVVPLDGGQG